MLAALQTRLWSDTLGSISLKVLLAFCIFGRLLDLQVALDVVSLAWFMALVSATLTWTLAIRTLAVLQLALLHSYPRASSVLSYSIITMVSV